MQKGIRNAATVIFICLAKFSFSFQDTTTVKRDTLQEKTIHFEPNFSKRKVKSLGNYVGVVEDSLTFQFSQGISVLNTVRGRMPNTGISLYAPRATVRENAAIVIDGLVYRQSSGNFYNMNGFDYNSLIFLGRGNAASSYGLYGSNGGFILQSKTGENQLKPTLEFNTYLTSAAGDPSDTEGSGTFWSNAIAYMQDFGKVDTRVSYSYLTSPESKSHNFKVNTGFDLHRKFKARLIVDNVNDKASNDSPYSTSDKFRRNLLQGNLMMKYEPLTWFALTSQSSLGKVKESDKIHSADQNKNLINVFANIKKNVGLFSFSAFGGLQYESWKYESSTSAGREYSYKSKYYLSGVDLGISGFLFAHVNYRKDIDDRFPEMETPTHALSLSFIFTEAFHWDNSFLSFGKLRSSWGEIYTDRAEPMYWRRTAENLFEIGSDLYFADNRLGFTINYFNQKEGNPKHIYSFYDYEGHLNTNGNIRQKGTELILTAIPIQRAQIEYQATLLWARSKQLYEDVVGYNDINNPDPTWTGSVLNQLTLKSLFLSCLIERNEEISPNSQTMVTLVQVRDASVGYKFSKLADKFGFREAQIALSIRNFGYLYYSADRTIADNYSSASISMSLAL